ncbi:MAG: YihY/virulence factor BrkB family protein [Flavobacteriaceae bacterium]|nr:YihY/virulence factor BrkB family protein [Flavobacteriaceae bacterium]
MTKPIENKLEKIPILREIVRLIQRVKIPGLEGLTLYDLLEMYIIGILRGALTSRAGSIAFSFFMALFPFLLFLLTLIPYVPIEGFQADFLFMIEQLLPPKTVDAVQLVIEDIIKNKYGGLLSFGFIASIFLMANGVNAIFGGFEISFHIEKSRNVIKQYVVALGISVIIALLLLVIVAFTVYFQIGIEHLKSSGWLDDDVFWIEKGRQLFFVITVLISVGFLFYFGTIQGKYLKFLSPGVILTTVLSIVTFYFFGIYVEKFASYNELYGSIGTLLILMIFVWLNSIILLLGFELNATINRMKRINKEKHQ